MEEREREMLPNEISDEQWRALHTPRLFDRFRSGPGVLIVLGLLVAFVAILLFVGLSLFGLDAFFAPEPVRPADQAAQIQAPGVNPAVVSAAGAPMAGLSLVSVPQGATVYIDFDSVGVTPLLGHPLEAGAWILSIRKDRYVPFDTILVVDGPVSLQLSLDAGASPPAYEADLAHETDGFLASYRSRDGGVQALPENGVGAADLEPDVFEGAAALNDGLLVTSDPPGASIWLDDQPMGETPLVLDAVQPGLRRIRFHKQGYAPYAAELELESLAGLHRTLTPLGSRVTIQVQPQGAIYIDGELHRGHSAEAYEAYLSAGSHRIKAMHPVLGTWEQVVHVDGDSAQYVTIDLNTMQARMGENGGREDENGGRATDSAPADAQRYQYVAGQGDALFNQGNYEEALVKYKEMLALKPGDAYAQEKISATSRILEEMRLKQAMLEAVVEDGVYVVSEEPPQLIGGLDMLQRKIRYPKKAYEAGVQGRVYVAFVVDEEGYIRAPRIVQGLGFGCDEEVLRVLKQARMQPGKVGGKPVKVRSTLYFDFVINR